MLSYWYSSPFLWCKASWVMGGSRNGDAHGVQRKALESMFVRISLGSAVLS